MRKLLQQSKVIIFEDSASPDDLRLKHIITAWDKKTKAELGIIGIPFDYGVKLSNGRVGAAQAPDEIRAQIKKYGTAYEIEKKLDFSKLRIVDFGNIATVAKNSKRTITNITKTIKLALRNVKTLIVIGGGHDISYATSKALSEINSKKIGGMNIDAHFDVRPVLRNHISSGTPFRMLLEKNYIKGKFFFEVASQGHLNSPVYNNWLKKLGTPVYFLSDVRRLGLKNIFKKFFSATKTCQANFISIDIDSVAQAFAPASSAPSPDGLSPSEVFKAAYLAGENSKVCLFEIMEVNPKYDVDSKTSRLAVNIIINFIAGFAKRKNQILKII